MNKVKEFLFRIKAVSTPLVGIELGDIPSEEKVESSEQAIRKFVSHLLWLKELEISLNQKDNALKFIQGLDTLIKYLQIHHALLPGKVWKQSLSASVNSIIVVQERLQSRENEEACIKDL